MAKTKKLSFWSRLMTKLNKNKISVIIVAIAVLVGTLGFASYQFNIGRDAQAALNTQTTTVNKICPDGASGTIDANGYCIVNRSAGYGNIAQVPVANYQVVDPSYATFNTGNGWNLVSGSVRNNWMARVAVLSDSVYYPHGYLAASPSAGFYGVPNSATIGILPIYRNNFVRIVACIKTLDDQYVTDFERTQNPAYPALCTFDGQSPSQYSQVESVFNISGADINNNLHRYLAYTPGLRDLTPNNNSTTHFEAHPGRFWVARQTPVANGTDTWGAEGYSADRPTENLDILANRFITFRVCKTSRVWGTDYTTIAKATNNAADYPACYSGWSNTTRVGVADLYNTEYKYTNDPADFGSGRIDYTVYKAAICPSADFSPSGSNATQCVKTTNISYTVDPASVGTGTCNGGSYVQGSTFNCNFPLSGAPAGVPYVMPAEGIYASIRNIPGNAATWSGNSNLCTISGSTLTCTNIPTTTNITPGAGKEVILHQPNIQWFNNKGSVTITAATSTITTGNIGNSSDCTSSKNVTIPNTYTCTFPLVPPTATFTLPSGGITASTSTATGQSPACTLAGTTLTCAGIPSLNGTPGERSVILTVSGNPPSGKGSVTLVAPVTPPTPIDYPNIGDSTDCVDTKTVTIPGSYDCTFPLTGSTTNTYSLPSGGVVALTGVDNSSVTPLANSASEACTITGNGTANAALQCLSLNTDGSTAGLKNVLAKIGATNPIKKGEVTLAAAVTPPTTITDSNVGTSTDCINTKELLIPGTYNCNFPLTGNANNNYALPAGGVIAWTGASDTGTAVLPNSLSNACSIQGNGTAQARITCNNIKTAGAVQGLKNVVLEIGTNNMHDRGDILLLELNQPDIIGPGNIQNSTDCTLSTEVVIPANYNCTFPLTGDPFHDYELPVGGIKASTSTATGQSQACTITENGTVNVKLSCTAIPTLNGTVGNRNVLLAINNAPDGFDKGDVKLVSSATTLGETNIGTCTPGSVTIGSTYNCSFTLTGASNNNYSLPAGGISANTSTSTGTSIQCTITNNGTAQATLQCSSIPTIGGTAGLQNVLLTIGTGSNATDKGDVTLTNSQVPTQISPVNVTDSTDCTNTKVVDIPQTFTCVFPLTGNSNNSYTLPTGNTLANVESNTSSSQPCTIINNNTAQASLQCTEIPTNGALPGVQDVILSIPGSAAADKGDVKLQAKLITSYIPLAFQSFVCTPDSQKVNQTINCTGTLKDGYLKPADTDGLYVKVNNTGAIEKLCNFTNQTDFTCSNVGVGSVTGNAKAVQASVHTLSTTTAAESMDYLAQSIIYVDTGETVNVTDGNGDTDGDGIPDPIEKGPDANNPRDTDGDGTPDFEDLDSDGDGIPDSIEKGADGNNPVDTDGDGTPDYRDLDSDGDGIPDSYEKTCSVKTSFLSTKAYAQSNVGLTISPCDTDGDGTPDYRDLNSDNDQVNDLTEKGNTCTSLTNCNPKDSDGNGIPDFRQKTELEPDRSGGLAIAGLIALTTGLAGIGLFVAKRQQSKLSKKVDLK